ncbi:MAG: hypothetical protein NVS3B21_16820 [Acidimicrobiales bacterium]
MPEPDRTCVVCGRRIEWRKKWARDWHAVRYCSDRCRNQKLSPADAAVEAQLLDALRRAPAGATTRLDDIVCAWGAGSRPPSLEPARAAARRLVARGAAEIIQGGRVVDPSTAKGAFGLRRSRDRP